MGELHLISTGGFLDRQRPELLHTQEREARVRIAEIVRIESFWIDTWLRSQYTNLEVIYVVHDAVARVVDQETFFHLRESGGTRISSAYSLCNAIIDAEYPPE